MKATLMFNGHGFDFGYILPGLIVAMAAVTFSLGCYLLYQFVISVRAGRTSIHWVGFWGAGGLLLFLGTLSIFYGGFLLLFVVNGLWAFAAWRCWRVPPSQVPPLAPMIDEDE